MIKRGAVLVAALVAIKAQALMNDDPPALNTNDGSGGGWVSNLWWGAATRPAAQAAVPHGVASSRQAVGAALALLERDMPWRQGGWVAAGIGVSARAPLSDSHEDLAQLLRQTHQTTQRLTDVWPEPLATSSWTPAPRTRLALPAAPDVPSNLPPRGGRVVVAAVPTDTPILFFPPPGWGGMGDGTDGDLGGDSVGGLGGGLGFGNAGDTAVSAPVPEPEGWALALAGGLLCAWFSRWRATRGRPHR